MKTSRIILALTTFLVTVPISVSQATSLPFYSDGSLGAFNPLEDVFFNTNTNGYTIGSTTFSGGVVRNMGANILGGSIETTVFNFTGFNLNAGIRLSSQGARPLTLLATENIFLGGIIDVSGSNGLNGLGGGGGAGGGAVSLLTNAQEIFIDTTGKIIANGGIGGEGDMNDLEGSGGIPSSSGGQGGSSGTIIAGGPGGAGGAGTNAGGGGGGGGGRNGNGGTPGPSSEFFSRNAERGQSSFGDLGGVGGSGGTCCLFTGISAGGSGGTGAAFPGGVGSGGSGASGLSAGGGGGGGGGDGLIRLDNNNQIIINIPMGMGGPGGAGAGGGGAGSPGGGGAVVIVGGQQGNNGVPGGVGGVGGSGAGGAIVLGAANSRVINFGEISVLGGLSNGSSGGSGGLLVLADNFENFGIVQGLVGLESSGFETPDDFLFVGGGGGGASGGPGEVIIERVPEPTFTLGLLALGTLGAGATLKRKLKSSKSTEKETTKVG